MNVKLLIQLLHFTLRSEIYFIKSENTETIHSLIRGLAGALVLSLYFLLFQLHHNQTVLTTFGHNRVQM